ncbi:lipoprotein-releasing system ATP-binding protein LolD [Cellulomonas algicola]|uniref:Lipoprotein-releasing system ATP-binding protein LolD n=1 Tax=Cellulomonas algicola TaxID=2071633 RepID=A0A401UX84_9CELL|nr:ATP-binding cassette domain-containing protein [Cellulomonas algicola]GCD19307.1 lipoprotein-releasing system ATP-binding protein LolD [Cellulomonas algicola]
MISVDALTFGYGPRTGPVLNDLTCKFSEGALTTITGPSGGGKSTLLYLLGLMLTPTAGTVVLDGVATARLPDGERARLRATQIGFVFQDAVLDPARTVLDNVMEGALFTGTSRRVAERRARDLLGALGVEHRHDHRPGQISGGQAQRVALCRALMKSPTIILADEPSGNLDPASADVVWDTLRERAQSGATVIVATHDPLRAPTGDARVQL